jgi:rhodanese-related sulfurtransferase
MRAKGFDNVVNLTGGFAAWQNAGLPVDHELPVEALAAVESGP